MSHETLGAGNVGPSPEEAMHYNAAPDYDPSTLRYRRVASRAVAVVAVAAAAVLPTKAAIGAPRTHTAGIERAAAGNGRSFDGISNNSDTRAWAGWGVEGAGTVNYVTADFDVPTITCAEDGSNNGDVSLWAGAGSGNSDGDPLYQTGVYATCVDGTVAWHAFYEVYSPDGDTGVLSYTYNHTISAGDQMLAQVFPNTGTGGKTVEFSLNDFGPGTTNPYPDWTSTATETYSSAPSPSEEECITEDYEYGGETVPLADFGTANYVTGTSAYAEGACNVTKNNNSNVISSNVGALNGFIGETGIALWTDDIYNSSDSTTLATTSGASSTGAFTVTWEAQS